VIDEEDAEDIDDSAILITYKSRARSMNATSKVAQQQ
jgi:hypothetical protein